MRGRTLTAAAAALVALAGPSADARTYCLLAVENKDDGDPNWYTRGPAPFGPWDLKSLDVAADKTRLTGVIRVGDLTNESPTAADDGGHYTLYFSAGTAHHFVLVAEIGGGRQNFELWRAAAAWGADSTATPRLVAPVSGVVDQRTDEIRMTVPLRTLGRGVATRGTRLSHFGGESQRRQLHTDDSVPPYWRSVMGHHQDRVSAREGVTYPVGAPSCVKVGR